MLFRSLNGKEAIGIAIQQYPSANSIAVANGIRATMSDLAKRFPAAVEYAVPYDATTFINESIKEVVTTLCVAIALVIAVIFLFLLDWRVTLIPAITIPISLIGTFGLMKLLGFSINTLTLFGLTLATGLVVDDAIVIVENITRYMTEYKLGAFESALKATREIAGAVVATSLVLFAVFIPVGFIPGTVGILYQQFALTIACSIGISLFNALTLTPALAALLLKPGARARGRLFTVTAGSIERIRTGYANVLPRVLALRPVVLSVLALGLVATFYLFNHIPTQFIPDEDQGRLNVLVQLPEGASLDQTTAYVGRMNQLIERQPEVARVFIAAGYGYIGAAPNRALAFVLLKPWAQRSGAQHSLFAVVSRINRGLAKLPGAQAFAFDPPAINGLGQFGGFTFEIEDQSNGDMASLMRNAHAMLGAAAQDPLLSNVFTQIRTDSPQLVIDVDRDKALALGVPLNNIFTAMQTYLGSIYVNNFSYLNRSWKVLVQADERYRNDRESLQNVYVASASGVNIPLATLIKVTEERSAPFITHFNLFRSIELSGAAAPGASSGQAIAEMQRLASRSLAPGYTYEWSGISREEVQAGAKTLTIFGLALVFVFLILAAQYESLKDPLIIILSVPFAILGALGALMLRGIHSDIFAQVGYVMLIGLASKNAILIVEFANQLQEQGLPPHAAVVKAAQTRLRPILMTSLAFVLGVLPLVFASGAGAESRHSLGTAVFGGMLVSTALNLFITPVIYLLFESRRRKRAAGNGVATAVAVDANGAVRHSTPV